MHAVSRAFASRLLAGRAPAAAAATAAVRRHTVGFARLQSTYVKPAAGVNPAYDEALKIIEAYSAKKAAEAKTAEAALAKAREAGANSEEIGALEKAWFDLAVESRINDGEVLWNARHGIYDLSQPVYRHLKQQAWRGRPLEILMQRLLQMYVLPDMLDPRVVGTPEAELSVSLADLPVIEPGVVVDPSAAREQPEIELVTLHDTPRLHTLVMVDLDEPYEEKRTFREQFHWVVANVPFSKDVTKADIGSGSVLLPYIPPHPAQGTPAHRYVFAAFEQADGGQRRIDGADVSRDMNVRDFVSANDLRTAGLSFFRASWTEAVDEVYRDVLGQSPPRFGPPTPPRRDIGPDGRKISSYANY
ncbi:mitochondrial 54S ribosomal protein YmL35 [Coemansia sp. RSA 552]|nr:mitochondrial 54S ribosomal protein YmL35 [Coemansia sp. RSA 552]